MNWSQFKKDKFSLRYTIMLIPHSQKRPINVKIPVWVFGGAFLLLVTLLSITSYFAYASYRLQEVTAEKQQMALEKQKLAVEKQQMALENASLKKISEEQEVQLADLQEKTGSMLETLDELEKRESEIRQEIGLEPLEASLDGQGGRQEDMLAVAEVSIWGLGDPALSKDLMAVDKNIAVIKTKTEKRFESYAALLKEVEEKKEKQERMRDSVPDFWPVAGGGVITSPFGSRSDPFGGGAEYHKGLDIAAPTGTAVYASGAGVVVSAGWSSSYGNTVEINHGNGYVTKYSHNSEIYVKSGDSVAKGQKIAAVGSTGWSTGPHLDFRVYLQGAVINPNIVLKR